MNRALQSLGLIAVVNLLALGGFTLYANQQHWLQRERVRDAVAVLTGHEKKKHTTTTAPADKSSASMMAHHATVDIDTKDEIRRIELDRRARELQDGWKLLETQQLALMRAKEEFEEQRKTQAAQEKARSKQNGGSGEAKELDILAGVKAKDAKELLRAKTEPEAVQILMKLETRSARKIVAQCKTPEERLWIGRILEKIRHVDATQAEVLGAGN